MEAVLESFDLTRHFNGVLAVDRLNISLYPGEVLGFLGPNGAGKTTTVRMLAGMIAPTFGHAVVCGVSTEDSPEKLHENIGLLTETPGFYERLSAWDNLLFFGSFYPEINPVRQAEKYLKAVGLYDRRNDRVAQFSKGMKQKLSVCRALLHEPKILFLDEPTSGLDPEARKEVRELIQNLRAEGRTIFLCTHQLDEAELLCDRIAVFKTRLMAMDKPANLKRQFFNREFALEARDYPEPILGKLKSLPYVERLEIEDGRMALEFKDPEASRPLFLKEAVSSGLAVSAFYEEKHSLEELYFSIVGEEKA